jgi:hypothetical protein
MQMPSFRDRMPRARVLGLALTAAVAAPAMAAAFVDFGADRETALHSQAGNLFGGIGNPLTANGSPAPPA